MRRTIASQRLHFTYFRLIIARFLRYVNRMSAFTTFLSVIFLEFLLVFMVFRYRFIINWCQVVVSHRHRKELLSCPKEANIFTNEKMDVGKHVINVVSASLEKRSTNPSMQRHMQRLRKSSKNVWWNIVNAIVI